MHTKLAQMKIMWAAGDYRGALKLAASWPQLGTHKEAITRGWAAVSNPKFYMELGQNPAALYKAGLVAVAERYTLEAPKGPFL